MLENYRIIQNAVTLAASTDWRSTPYQHPSLDTEQE